MLNSNFEINYLPIDFIFLLSLSFSDLFIVWFKNRDVEHRYFNYSAVMPFLSRFYHFLKILSLAFTVVVYFLTNWKIIGVSYPFFLKFNLNYFFLFWNYFSSFLLHFPNENSLWSLISTFVNPFFYIYFWYFLIE